MRAPKTVWGRLFPLLFVMALVAAACGGDDDARPGGPGGGGDEAAQGGSFSIHICEPSGLIPQRVVESCGHQVLKSLFVGLVDYDEEGEPFNVIAESIESEDNQNWTVTLQEGWTFHNGEDVTAETFVNAWNWGARGSTAADGQYFFQAAQIKGVEEVAESNNKNAEMEGLRVVDDLTFEVELDAPFVQFPLTLGYTVFYPLPNEFFESKENQFNRAPIGNGPYQMEGRWERDQFVNVTRYDDFNGTPGLADDIEFRIYSDPNTAYTDVQAGDLDVLEGVPTEVLGGAEGEFGDRFMQIQTSYIGHLGFPLYEEPYDDLDVRRAISMAIDREAITETIFQGAYTPADSFINPVVTGHREGACGEWCEYRPEEAKELWDNAANTPDTVSLWFNADGGHQEWMEAVGNQVRQNLGVEVEYEGIALFDDFLERQDDKTLEGPFRFAWVFDYPSPQNYLEPMFACDASSNSWDYCNEEFDEAVREGNRADSIDAGTESYQRADDILLEDLPATPLWFGQSHAVHSENVQNVIVDAFQTVRVAEIEVVEQDG